MLRECFVLIGSILPSGAFDWILSLHAILSWRQRSDDHYHRWTSTSCREIAKEKSKRCSARSLSISRQYHYRWTEKESGQPEQSTSHQKLFRSGTEWAIILSAIGNWIHEKTTIASIGVESIFRNILFVPFASTQLIFIRFLLQIIQQQNKYEETSTDFDITPAKYPPLIFSRVKSYVSTAHQPIWVYSNEKLKILTLKFCIILFAC